MTSWLSRNIVNHPKDWRSPFLQASFWALAAVLGLGAAGLANSSTEIVWGISATMVLCYSIFNSLIGIFSKSWFKYFLWSSLAYICLVLLCLLATNVLAGQNLDELNEFRGVYAALFLSYFMIMMVASAIRSIASYLQIDEMPNR